MAEKGAEYKVAMLGYSKYYRDTISIAQPFIICDENQRLAGEDQILAIITVPKENQAKAANLICSAVNSCISINKDNPLAVAEGMEELWGAFKDLMFQFAVAVDDVRSKDEEVYNRCDAIRSKMEDKITGDK